MARFSDTVYRRLKDAGWHEGRRVNISSAVAELEQKGLAINPVAKGTLEEFYGLSLHEMSFLNDGNIAPSPDADELNLIAPLVAEAPCLIGYAGGYIYALPSGRIMHVDDYWYAIAFADSLETFLNALCSRVRPYSQVIILDDSQKPADWRSTAE